MGRRTRRLHHNRFDWPEDPRGRQKLTARELACLLMAGDVKKLHFKQLLVSDEQLQLAPAELEAERREQEVSEKEVAGYNRRGKKDRDLQPRIPDHLEVIREVIIPEEVQADPEAWEWISDEVTEELDIEPTRFIKRLIIRPKYVRKGVVDAKPVVAKLAPRVIPRGIPSAALMAFIIVSKFADHLPLYRLEKILGERYKVPIRRQRMCDWIGYVVDNWLNLIYHSIRQGLFKSDYLQRKNNSKPPATCCSSAAFTK